MTRAAILALAAALGLAACGADGPPLSPSRDARPDPGIRLTGDARLGLSWGAP